MGKITNKSEVEIIPLKENPVKRNLPHYPNMQKIPYISDPTIVPRVQKYLESNVDKTYVDINVMADELQQKYREYAKRKRSAFRASVKKAYSIVLQSYGLEDQGSSSDLSDDDEDEGVLDQRRPFGNNSMSSQLVDLYTCSPGAKQVVDNELIDISSDDSEPPSATYQSNNKNINGPPSTSILPHPIHQSNNYPKRETTKRGNEKPNETSTNAIDRGKKRKIESSNNGNISLLKSSTTKKRKTQVALQNSTITFKDVGGMDKALEEVCKLLIHIRHPELYKQIGVSSPRGFLLHGPPGCGKTLLANAIAGELNIPLLKVAAPELVAGMSGESEERIRELFENALASSPCILFIDEIDAITQNRQNAQKEMEKRIVAQLLSCLDDLNQSENGNSVLVIGATNRPDSIDPALRRAGRFDKEICVGIPDVQSRVKILKVLTSNLKLAEGFDFENLAKYTPGFVGADLLSLIREAAMIAVNRMFNELREKHLIDQTTVSQTDICQVEPQEDKTKESDLKKNDTEIIIDDEVSVDNDISPVVTDTPAVILDDSKEGEKVLTVEENDKPSEMACEGIVSTVPEEKIPEVVVQIPRTKLQELVSWLHDQKPLTDSQLENLFITTEDFQKALKCVQPSAKREGFATVPDVSWDDVGSLGSVREELQMAILAPVRHEEQFKALGLNVPTGVLLCGPPGCGKTLLAKAIANEAGINFISVKGPELLNMYVGESERAVRVCFERARNSAPCVIFFDELDALCPKRSDSREGGPTMRVVNQMLTEMDGVEGRKGVFLLAASNRPDIVDPAVLRPGRLDKIIYVGLPSASDRVDILRTITKNGTQPKLSPDVDLEIIGTSEQCKGYTGADLAALVREAGVQALKEYMLRGEIQQPVMVTTEHFKTAVAKIRPSVSDKDQKHYEKLRKIYTAVPDQEVEEMEYS